MGERRGSCCESNWGGAGSTKEDEDGSPVMVIAGFSVDSVEGETNGFAAPLSTTSV